MLRKEIGRRQAALPLKILVAGPHQPRSNPAIIALYLKLFTAGVGAEGGGTRAGAACLFRHNASPRRGQATTGPALASRALGRSAAPLP
jgi:hypothetical protein